MKQLKTIKSFIRRQRKLSPSKQIIFDELWPQYGLEGSEGSGPFKAPTTLEIGFGYGENIFSLSQKHPEQNFIGIEIHLPGIANLLALIKKYHAVKKFINIKIYNEDAVAVLKECIPDNSLDKILILFPDPWPKKRHHKRRLIQPEFIKLLQQKLKAKGILNIATDWENYANHIIDVLKNNPGFSMIDDAEANNILPKRDPTKFEKRGKDKRHKNFDLLFVKQQG